MADAILGMPQGPARRRLIAYWVREFMAGTFDRADYDLARAFMSPDFEGRSAPELAALVGQEPGERLDSSTFFYFLDEWRSAWGEVIVRPQEVIDLGQKIFVLNNVTSRGAGSGLELDHPRESELYEFRNGQCCRWQQWWSWDEALEAAGLSE